MSGSARTSTVRLVSATGWVFLFVLGAAQPVQAQGRLDWLRRDVRAPDPADSDDSDAGWNQAKRRHARNQNCEDNDSESGGFASRLISSLFADDDDCTNCATDHDSNDSGGSLFLLAAGVSSPWWVPIAISGDDYSTSYYDLPFPYTDSTDGYLTHDPTTYFFPNWSLRTQVDYGTDLSKISFLDTRMLLETTTRWGVDSELRYWQEETDQFSDQLWTGDANLVFRFARVEYFQMRSGLGCNWLADEDGSDFGFNFTYGGDWFPQKPLIVSADIDWGRLGNSGLFHGRATVGANLFPVEAYTGFDYFDTSSFCVSSWISGVRVWF